MRFLLTRKFLFLNDGAGGTSPPPPPPPPATGTFTQDQVNAMMAKHKREMQEQNKKLSDDLATALEKINLTEAERAGFEETLGNIKSQHLTEAQKLTQENEKWKKKYEKDMATAAEEGKSWKSRFETTVITNAILQGASQHKAIKDTQLVDLLSGRAKVVQDVDDAGKPTGGFTVKLPVKTTDPKTKEAVVIELPVAEAIGEMKKDEGYFNLFESDDKSGLGGSGNARTKSTGNGGFQKNMSKDNFFDWMDKERKR